MGLFKQRKHKRFNYTPRHLRDAKDDENSIQSQWETVRGQGKRKGKRTPSMVLLLVILGIIIALWYILTHYETS